MTFENYNLIEIARRYAKLECREAKWEYLRAFPENIRGIIAKNIPGLAKLVLEVPSKEIPII